MEDILELEQANSRLQQAKQQAEQAREAAREAIRIAEEAEHAYRQVRDEARQARFLTQPEHFATPMRLPESEILGIKRLVTRIHRDCLAELHVNPAVGLEESREKLTDYEKKLMVLEVIWLYTMIIPGE